MDIHIKANPRPVGPGDFHYSNMNSRYGVNTQYFTRDGAPFTVIAGELHFSRLPQNRWRETLLKLRECGVNTVSNYVFWNHHEEKKGAFDFTGDRDIAAFLQTCKDIDMPCILRIGPWCHGEVSRGGFPKRIRFMKGKRRDNKAYLAEVRDYWTRLYGEVKHFLDGETVIGIQLENEYTGPTSHIRTLRSLAESIGFQTPFFTMTAWPSGVPDRNFLPMMGGYPDGPWIRGNRPLKPNNRFAITMAKTEDEIGADLFKHKKAKAGVYDDVPYAFCEIGPGNQVTQHRRPFISEKDGYGVGFAKFASGANWLGYYMFCGGRNPNDRLLQECSLNTGFPCNYAIIDYDFQAPISRYGVCRPHGDRLRLMHLFINEFDRAISTKQAFFPKWSSHDPCDTSFLKCSVRADSNGSGYFFAGTYEKGLHHNGFRGVTVTFEINQTEIKLPKIDVKSGVMFFYPFHMQIGSVNFDYILAQPIAKSEADGKTVCYFAECEGIAPECCTNGEKIALDFSAEGTTIGDVRLIVIPYQKARQFHFIGGKACFLEGTVYEDGGKILCEQVTHSDLKNKITLNKSEKENLPYNYYLYSLGSRGYYQLKLPKNILENRYDVVLAFDFEGLNLQVFSGGTLINDYFNIDQKFVMHLRDYEQYIKENPILTIRTAPKTKVYNASVFHEIPVPYHSNQLALNHVNEIQLVQVETKDET